MRVEPVGADDVSKTRTRFQDPNRRHGSHGHSVPGPCIRLGTWGCVFFFTGLFRRSRPRSRLGTGAGYLRTWPRQTRTRLSDVQEFYAAALGSPLL